MPYRAGDDKVTKYSINNKTVKTFICKKTVQYLGFMINKDGITTTEQNIEKKITPYQRQKKKPEAILD